MDVLPAHLNRDSFRDSLKGLVALEIILDLPLGFPINNIISRKYGMQPPAAGTNFWRENSRRVCITTYSRPVCVIYEISRPNPKIPKISKLCLILIHEEVSKKKFQNSVAKLRDFRSGRQL